MSTVLRLATQAFVEPKECGADYLEQAIDDTEEKAKGTEDHKDGHDKRQHDRYLQQQIGYIHYSRNGSP